MHGGLHDAELGALGLGADDVLDFSSSTNPYGPAPAMLRALAEAAIGRYPDSSGRHARARLGEQLGVAPDSLVLGNGAADLLWTLARCLLGPGRRALIVEPTFSELRAAAGVCGATIDEWRCRAEDDFRVDLSALAAQAAGANLVYLCSPNTPTGTALALDDVESFARAEPERIVVLDQSFASLSEVHADLERGLPANVVCVRSLTKDHGIPGVRVGYLLAAPALCSALEASRPAWTTSAFAQAAVVASCSCAGFVAESRARLLVDRRELAADLEALGFRTLPSRATFLLAEAPDISRLRVRLLAGHHILVRDCASFGLPGYMRLGAKPSAARARLLEALRAEGRRA